MAEFCRQCALKYLGEIEAKHTAGACKPGETFWEFCEGCANIVEIDSDGWRIDEAVSRS